MDSQVSLTIELRQPFDLASSLESGQAFRWHRHGNWRYGVVSDRLVALRQDGSELYVRAASDPEDAAAAVRDYLRIDDDIEAVYSRIGADDHLSKSINCGIQGDAHPEAGPVGVPGGLHLLRQLQHPSHLRQHEHDR